MVEDYGRIEIVDSHISEQLRKQRESVQTKTQATEVEVIAFIISSFALQQRHQTTDLEWLTRRFREMHDILQDAPIFQEILQEGREQGHLEATQHILHLVTEKRFPALAPLAQQQATRIQSLDAIDTLIVAISSAQNELEAHNALQAYK